jgi:hypothetical protein
VRVEVICHAGYRGEETPRRLRVGAREVAVESILDRWTGRDHRYFKVRGDDGATYILRRDDVGDFWEITFYDRRG